MSEIVRTTPPELESYYRVIKKEPSDINEHLDLLRDLASQCEHVTEFGMRGANGSTVAFLVAQPATFIAWDLNPWSIVSQSVANLIALKGRTNFMPRCGNTLEIVTEPTDLLFIDTYHVAKQLKAELERHADPLEMRVKKYIIFHDTQTFGTKGEDGSEPGLRAAIRWFQKEHSFPQWQLMHDLPNNNGLVVLRSAAL